MRERILIVDDHPTNVEILRLILESDYELMEAGSGDEALTIAPEFRPDLVLLDIMMPGIDGYETCRRLRQIDGVRGCKIVMVSAKALASERLQGYESGADDYITKPFEEDELLAKVRVYMQLSRAVDVTNMKADVLALLNHELKTPMNCIKAPIDLLLDTEIDNAEDRRMLLEMASTSVDRLSSLFEKTVTLCALQSGQIQVDREPLALNDLVRSCMERIIGKYPGRALVKADLDQFVRVAGDEKRLSFVIEAVIENALLFGPVGGEVRIALRVDGDDAVLTVQDAGEGVPETLLPKIFEPFASRDVAHHGGGHGLSLAIAKHLVRAHEGNIELGSHGQGAAMDIRLPVCRHVPSADDLI